MTLDEAKKIGERLNALNLDFWFNHEYDDKEFIQREFRELSKSIVSNGFKMKFKKTYSEKHKCMIKEIYIAENRHKDAISIVDNRSALAKYKGDCTTRCICFCTGREYDDVQKEQFRRATRCYSWKNIHIWKQLLIDKGYIEIDLPRKISRAVFLRTFKDSGLDEGIIATVSSGHVAAIDMAQKKVLDTWDSSGGRIYKIFVPSNADAWKRKINALLG